MVIGEAHQEVEGADIHEHLPAEKRKREAGRTTARKHGADKAPSKCSPGRLPGSCSSGDEDGQGQHKANGPTEARPTSSGRDQCNA